MTELLDRAVSRVKTLPAAQQDDVARLLLDWIGEDHSPLDLSPEEEASFASSLAQAERGAFASEAEIREIWAKYGL